MSATCTLLSRSSSSSLDRRLRILLRIIGSSGARCPVPVVLGGSRPYSKGGDRRDETQESSVAIGDVRKTLKKPRNPELVPVNYLAKDAEIPPETLRHLKWMMQKDLLGQDIFLIGRPSPLRRSLAMQYLELTRREMEFVSLSRDTTESDLKQRREIQGGTAHYIDQSAVKAASEGRVLVLEGIEKAERNVLPVLNNLLENREMHLEDGRLLIPASRYDKLLEEHTQEELDNWRLVRVSEDFRVIALGLPVPKYIGNPLDPPLRSRFQSRDVRHLPFKEQLQVLQSLGGNLSSEILSQVLSFAHTMVTDESSNLGLPDFPVENLPPLIAMMNQVPSLSAYDALQRLYPYKAFLPEDGCRSVEDTLNTFQIPPSGGGGGRTQILSVESISAISSDPGRRTVEIKVDGSGSTITVPAGPHTSSSSKSEGFVQTAYHDWFLAELMLSHSVKDFCIVGPRGCGKSVVVGQLADLLGYDIMPIMLYQDMTARDLLQTRTTMPNGDTVWRYSPLVTACLEGKMAVIDGLHRIHRGTLAVLHRLVHDRELQLYDGTRLIRWDRYETLKTEGGLTDQDMAQRKVLPIKPNFRIAALAEPPVVGGSSKEQWLTPEILSMFMFHTMRPLSQKEEHHVLRTLTGEPTKTLEDVLALTHSLRKSEDSSLKSIANSLSTRQLLRVSRRLHRFEGESAEHAVHKACLARFLPTLPRETLDRMMKDMGIVTETSSNASKGIQETESEIVCRVTDGILTIGSTSAPVFSPEAKTKVPETLFYDTAQNVDSMETMLQDFLLGEHLLLVGNQGVGKNKLVDRMLNLLNRPREYIQLHRDTTVQSLTLSPTVREGVIVYEDSPLVKAVKNGHILMIDEADKAPTHVTCILKTLVESGEMILSDGRRIVDPRTNLDRLLSESGIIRMHPDFRMIVLANRPGFPFLGNDFFGALGDLFSCHAIDNPSMESELSMLKQYGPNVPDETLRRLVKAFAELRAMSDDGQIQYPYSTREVVNIVKHLERFPSEGLGNVARNVFDFDSYDKETKESLEEVLHKHGIPIGISSRSLGLAREFPLPPRRSLGQWQVQGGKTGGGNKYPNISVVSRPVSLSGPQQLNKYTEPLDRVEARGVGFSEMQSYWSLPFQDFAVAGDVCVTRDQLNRQLYDEVHVCTANPVSIYTMRPTGTNFSRIGLNHLFDTKAGNALPRVRVTSLPKKKWIAVHEEINNTLVLLDPESGVVTKLEAGERFMDSVVEMTKKVVAAGGGGAAARKAAPGQFHRMLGNFADDSKLLVYTPNGSSVQLIDLGLEDARIMSHQISLPVTIASIHPLNPDKYIVVGREGSSGSNIDGSSGGEDSLFLLSKEDLASPMPTVLSPISQTSVDIRSIHKTSKKGLGDFGLRVALGENISTPNTLMATDDAYATIVLGFPDLEFSSNEVVSWPKGAEASRLASQVQPTNALFAGRRYHDSGRGVVFLGDSCQIVRPVAPQAIPAEYARNNIGLSSPGQISNYLEVVDLMSSKLRYIPVPEPAQKSAHSTWYKQTYPDQTLALAEMSNEGLVSVDNAGTVRLWETGVANLERSLNDWRRMLGEREPQLTIERDKAGELGTPKHGQVDPNNQPHVGGSNWAGGTGGRDTAGMGGYGGPYRLDAGHNVHQLSDEVKALVPDNIRQAAREMNRKAFAERLREIQMSQYDADLYEKYASQIRKQVQALKMIINGLQAKAKDRQWLKNQTSGELDDTRLIEGITGEKAIYKKRGEQDPEPGAPQEKPKRLRVLVDVSGSMYRFNGLDQRLERSMESALLVMEALEGYQDKIKYDIFGHSGEEKAIPFSEVGKEAKNEKERLDILRMMHAHSQFCMSGDHTLPATVTAITELAKMTDEHDESIVIVLSDANFDRYGISPKAFAKILNKNDKVSAFAIFIGSLGDQADRLAKSLPSGKAFVCMDTKKIPEILKTIFTSTMLK